MQNGAGCRMVSAETTATTDADVERRIGESQQTEEQQVGGQQLLEEQAIQCTTITPGHVTMTANNESENVRNGAGASDFYTRAQKYWSDVPATVNGMLGGLGYISAIDIQGSSSYLRELRLGNRCALDCGAGIGRVSKYLLMPRFACVDMVEQDPTFAEKARQYCITSTDSVVVQPTRVGTIHNVGLQNFTPMPGKYDLIWSQWVLGHLTDDDLMAFFKRMRLGLAKDGYFVMKENVTSTGGVDKDDVDSSVIRPLKMYEKMLRQAGYRIVKVQQQRGFPKSLYSVYIIGCRPQKTSAS